MIIINYFNMGTVILTKEYKELLTNCFFILFLLFSTATKFRILESPFGLFDLLTLSFFFLAYWSGRLDVKVNFHIISYSALFFLLLFVSYLLNSCKDVYVLKSGITPQMALFYHDMLAYLYCFFILYMILYINVKKNEILLYIKFSIFLSLPLIIIKSLGGFSFFYAERFSFLSTNPNQFALAIVPFPFLICYLMKDKKNYIYLSLMLIAVFFIGVKIRSFALLLPWVILFPLYIILNNFNNIKFNKKIVLLFSLVLFVLGSYIFSKFFQSFCHELSVRLHLWGVVIKDIWNHGLVLGTGPGVLTKFFVQPSNALLGYVSHLESHNTYLELIKQSGVIPFFILSFFLIKYLSHAFRARQWELLFTLISILSFAFSHSCLRTPIFYIYIVVFYKLLYNYKTNE